MDGKPQSLPFDSMRSTFQATKVAQDLLNHFEQALQMLRPQNAAEPAASVLGQF